MRVRQYAANRAENAMVDLDDILARMKIRDRIVTKVGVKHECI